MDPFASKLGFSAAAAAAAVLGAIYPVPKYETPDLGRPWARSGAANAWQPAYGIADRYSYAGMLPSSSGPIDVYGQRPWVLARERQILARQEAEMRALLAEPVAIRPEEEVLDDPEAAPAPARAPQAAPHAAPYAAVVTVVRGSKEAEAVPLDPPPLAVVTDE